MINNTSQYTDNLTQWETKIAELISIQLEIPYSDATGIMDANEFLMSQCWGMGLDAIDTANKIIN